MQLSYFGSAEAQLLGCYTPPAAEAERDAAVLVCAPSPQEYMWAHRALRQLATRLAAAGLHVLRFDYFGTGDSAGASTDGDLERWRADIAAALEELRDVSGVRRPSLVGFRLGATLAAQTPTRLRDLVLWEPVLSGAAHLRELRAAHEAAFAHNLFPPRLPRRGPLHELMGVPLPPRVEAQLEQLELSAPFACQSDRVLVVSAGGRPGYSELVERLSAAGTRAALEPVADSMPAGEAFLMATSAQQRIAQLVAGKAA